MKKVCSAIMAALAVCTLSIMCACSNETDDMQQNPQFESALALYTEAWGTVAEDNKFPVAGGSDFVMDAPGAFDISANWDAFAAQYMVTADQKAELGSDAATMMHMMNANIFTGFVAPFAGSDVQAFADKYIENLKTVQWLCGSPDKAVVMQAAGYVVCAYGANLDAANIDNFVAAIQAVCPSATVLAEANFA